MRSVPIVFDPRVRLAGDLGFATAVLFALAAVAVHLLRADLDGWRAPMSFYLSGDYGWLLQAAYVGLALGIAALAVGLWRALQPTARRGLSVGLLVAGLSALVVTALFPGWSPTRVPSDLERLLHGVSASMAFLCMGVAMLLQSLDFRRDPRWRGLARYFLWVAVLAFVALWLHVLWKALPRGASQKLVVALYLLWLGGAGWVLRRGR